MGLSQTQPITLFQENRSLYLESLTFDENQSSGGKIWQKYKAVFYIKLDGSDDRYRVSCDVEARTREAAISAIAVTAKQFVSLSKETFEKNYLNKRGANLYVDSHEGRVTVLSATNSSLKFESLKPLNQQENTYLRDVNEEFKKRLGGIDEKTTFERYNESIQKYNEKLEQLDQDWSVTRSILSPQDAVGNGRFGGVLIAGDFDAAFEGEFPQYIELSKNNKEAKEALEQLRSSLKQLHSERVVAGNDDAQISRRRFGITEGRERILFNQRQIEQYRKEIAELEERPRRPIEGAREEEVEEEGVARGQARQVDSMQNAKELLETEQTLERRHTESLRRLEGSLISQIARAKRLCGALDKAEEALNILKAIAQVNSPSRVVESPQEGVPVEGDSVDGVEGEEVAAGDAVIPEPDGGNGLPPPPPPLQPGLRMDQEALPPVVVVEPPVSRRSWGQTLANRFGGLAERLAMLRGETTQPIPDTYEGSDQGVDGDSEGL